MRQPVIIEAAISGATPKTVNPNVPVTEDEIFADALACFEAGAAIVHQHISNFNVSGDEAAEVYLGIWRRVLAGPTRCGTRQSTSGHQLSGTTTLRPCGVRAAADGRQ